jgi:RimJ/RimL family protein N-acetyltransferase
MEGMLSYERDDISFGICVRCGCVLLRVFDMGRYYFPFPYEVEEDADLCGAIRSIAYYAMREELPLVFTDTPIECLQYFSMFLHMNLDREESDEPSYRVTVKTELDLLSEYPVIESDALSLIPLSRDHERDFAILSRDEQILKYWGYDYRLDAPSVSDSYFIETALYERERGVSLSYAVIKDGNFVGESVIYGFDGMGGAEFAVRIKSEHQGRGIGSLATEKTIELCKKMGLKTIRAIIYKENKPSVRMAKKYMEEADEDGGRVEFLLDLA